MIELRRCLGGREAGRACCQGGACLRKGQLFGAGFLEEVVVHHYY
ncbi:MAG: hypothetical protein PHH76_02745 [Methanothrix soehngenii]|nr:hypothetical protein [Methanothrix soehngenii]MDD5256466.1 hypothetical protein [Methanothrix soehngenii]